MCFWSWYAKLVYRRGSGTLYFIQLDENVVIIVYYNVNRYILLPRSIK